uniref:BZIP domain-containing protein n=1 Tax=Strongyloides stercoralis TaxID=6248 RepID=A0A0K0E7B4_STRER
MNNLTILFVFISFLNLLLIEPFEESDNSLVKNYLNLDEKNIPIVLNDNPREEHLRTKRGNKKSKKRKISKKGKNGKRGKKGKKNQNLRKLTKKLNKKIRKLENQVNDLKNNVYADE